MSAKTQGLACSPDNGLLFLFGVNAGSLPAVKHRLVLDDAVYESVESVITADTDIDAGMDMCASLAIDYVSGENDLAVCLLGSETLSGAVAAVLGGTDALLMREELER
jgi:hypothetical protein